MKNLSPAALSHILRHTQTLTTCWQIIRQDGLPIRGTTLDENVFITTGDLAGLYLRDAGIQGSDIRNNSDLSVDNMEVTGSTQRDLSIQDIRAVDIEAGLLDEAVVTIFLVNWKLPDAFQIVIKHGTLGDISRTHEGQYRTELRGLTQQLTKNFIRTYSIICDAELYDERCTVDRASHTYIGTVTAVTNRKSFTVNVAGAPADQRLVGGKITFTSGLNDDFSMEVKSFAAGALVTFFPMPLDVEIGDSFEIEEGCDKTKATCKDVFNNLLNRRADGDFVPGQNEVLKVGGQERATAD